MIVIIVLSCEKVRDDVDTPPPSVSVESATIFYIILLLYIYVYYIIYKSSAAAVHIGIFFENYYSVRIFSFLFFHHEIMSRFSFHFVQIRLTQSSSSSTGFGANKFVSLAAGGSTIKPNLSKMLCAIFAIFRNLVVVF